MINDCCIIGGIDAKSVHCMVIKTGFEHYKLISNALVDMSAKTGNLNCAYAVFEKMLEKDVISWTSLVSGYAQNSSHKESLKIFCDMRIAGVSLDQFIIASILSACAELTLLEFGKQVHSDFVKLGLRSSLSVDNALVSMYAKCGCLGDADAIFASIHVRDVTTWTSLIVGDEQNVTGLVDEGRTYFQQMKKIYGIKSCTEYYACMIDLFGRLGKLDEAKEILNQMDVKPDATVWKALLAVCKVHSRKWDDAAKAKERAITAMRTAKAASNFLTPHSFKNRNTKQSEAVIKTLAQRGKNPAKNLGGDDASNDLLNVGANEP
ncbi:hypothetical protein VNO78_07961 [Psophocarpus tetragonolobus]|uniref:Pentatricopeptide repeat-containing protein n=1 Tax=Psophocarpus tetragonolobus TaxID=3891 RepID=A0AAN9T465_PSOTE